MPAQQTTFDLEYDDRVPRLGLEVAILLAPHLVAGTTVEATRLLADRIAKLCWDRLRGEGETSEVVRCWKCASETTPKSRVRVAICCQCSVPEPETTG